MELPSVNDVVVLSGLCAEEIHLCGEASAINIVQEMAQAVGDEFEVRKYKRLTSLTVLDTALGMNFCYNWIYFLLWHTLIQVFYILIWKSLILVNY